MILTIFFFTCQPCNLGCSFETALRVNFREYLVVSVCATEVTFYFSPGHFALGGHTACHHMCLSQISHHHYNVVTKKYLRLVVVKTLRNSVFARCGESWRQSGGAQVFLIGLTITSIIAIYAVHCVNIIYTNTLTQRIRCYKVLVLRSILGQIRNIANTIICNYL